MLNVLIEVLQDMAAVNRELLQVADQKREVLIERNITELDRLVKIEAVLVKKLVKLEEDRLFQVEEYVKRSHLSFENLTFSALVETIQDEKERTELQSLIQQLTNETALLKERNALNERLIKDSLTFVNYMVDQMTAKSKQNLNYQHPTSRVQNQSSSGRSFFDTKA
jgi:flagellar biosynthesis/type III secretory pathway chaperone